MNMDGLGTPATRKPYSGSDRKLVIAIDVGKGVGHCCRNIPLSLTLASTNRLKGTTYSGASYSILDPGEVPKVYGVTRFPSQEDRAGSSKIPSVLLYDKRGNLKAAGAEVDHAQTDLEERNEDKRVEW